MLSFTSGQPKVLYILVVLALLLQLKVRRCLSLYLMHSTHNVRNAMLW